MPVARSASCNSDIDSPALTSTPGPAVFISDKWGTRRRLAEVVENAEDDAIDEAVDRALKMGQAPKFLTMWSPRPTWLWRQWRGTVIQQTYQPALFIMGLSAILQLCIYQDPDTDWALLSVPRQDHWLVAKLRSLDAMWNYMLPMATFVNTFFLSQAYGYWLNNKNNCRKIQGRLNDFGFLLSTHARRDETGAYIPKVEEILDDVSRYVRLFHIFFWSALLRPSRGDRGVSYAVLRTGRGMERLRAHGALTEREHEVLFYSGKVAETGRHWAVLQWITMRFEHARKEGLLSGGHGLEQTFLDKACLSL